MIEKINFSNLAFKGNVPQAKEKSVNVNDNNSQTKGDFYIDKKTAEALAAFVAHPINNNKPIAMDTYVAQLKAAGMKEGEDFEVHKDTLFIKNYKDKDQLRKVVYWSGGTGIENYDGYDDVFYSRTSDDSVRFTHDRNGKLTGQANLYMDADLHQHLFPQNIDINTTAEDYMKLLEKQGVKYKTETKHRDNVLITHIAEYSKDDEITKITGFYTSPHHKAVNQSILDKNGKNLRTTDIVKEDDRKCTLRVYQSIDAIMEAVEKLKT